MFTTRTAARMVLFSVVSVRLSVNTITREQLEILSRNFQRIILWMRGRTIKLYSGARAVIWRL